MKLLMVYNFDHHEAEVENPNFYRSCAEKVFPKLSVSTSFLPDLARSLLYKVLILFKVDKGQAYNVCIFFWLIRYGHKYDVIVGWLTGGIIAGFLKGILRWHNTRVCLILYRVPAHNYSGIIDLIKKFVLRISSNGANRVLALDRLQAISFAEYLGREPDSTKALLYGIDTDWYDSRIMHTSQVVSPSTIFCPGSAHRDDSILENAVFDIDVCVKRYQLDDTGVSRRISERVGRAHVEKNYNAHYDDYISDCQNSSMVVIAVENSDKPVGLTALLECMALGRPVIISNGASSRDYVSDGFTGLLFEEGNWQQLSDKIQFLLEHPDVAERIGANAREQARLKYGLYPCGERFHHLIHDTENAH